MAARTGSPPSAILAATLCQAGIRHHRSIDAVLLDVQMPSTDGPQTLAALRRIDRRALERAGGPYSGGTLLLPCVEGQILNVRKLPTAVAAA
jgi:CheY-like chemotaxis protein